jgi:hypothetical protein
MKRKSNSIELLNSEGPILTAVKISNSFHIIDERGKLIVEWNQKEIEDFIFDRISVTTSENRILKYGSFPSSMKPDLRVLAEFIGIYAEGIILPPKKIMNFNQ